MAASAPAGDPFEALGDPNRRAIVELLSARGPIGAGARRRAPDQPPGGVAAPPAAEGSGPRRRGAVGTRRIYRLQDQGIEAVQAYLAEVWGDAVARFRLTAENTKPARPGQAKSTDRARDRAAPAELRDRLPGRARLRRLDDAAVDVVAEGPFRVRRPRHASSCSSPASAAASSSGRPDGTEIDWGEITLWSPPSRLGYLWHIGRDRSDATDVELTFVDVGDGRTRLDIVHSRLGAARRRGRRLAGGEHGGLERARAPTSPPRREASTPVGLRSVSGPRSGPAASVASAHGRCYLLPACPVLPGWSCAAVVLIAAVLVPVVPGGDTPRRRRSRRTGAGRTSPRTSSTASRWAVGDGGSRSRRRSTRTRSVTRCCSSASSSPS